MLPVSDKGAAAFNHANALKLIQKDIYQAQEEYEAARYEQAEHNAENLR